jgi:hypothetical protein
MGQGASHEMVDRQLWLRYLEYADNPIHSPGILLGCNRLGTIFVD